MGYEILKNRNSFNKETINLWLLTLYFIIRIPITFFISLTPNREHSEFIAISIISYVIILILIWHNRKNLQDYHFDRLSIYFILLFGSLLRYRSLDTIPTLLLEIFFFALVVIGAIVIIVSKTKFPHFSLFNFWNGIAILVSLCFSCFLVSIDSQQNSTTQNANPLSLFFSILSQFVIQMGLTVIIEEPIYRGFLWGTLKKRGWRNIMIFFFQAFLFWISHGLSWNHIVFFWVAVPLFSLLLGFLSWKSRSIFPPMIAHALTNAFLYVFPLR